MVYIDYIILRPEQILDHISQIIHHDFIFFDNSLSQFRKPEQIISKIKKFFNPKGKMIFLDRNSTCIINIFSLISLSWKFIWRFPVLDQLHLFKLEELKLLFKKQNLIITDFKTFKENIKKRISS